MWLKQLFILISLTFLSLTQAAEKKREIGVSIGVGYQSPDVGTLNGDTNSFKPYLLGIFGRFALNAKTYLSLHLETQWTHQIQDPGNQWYVVEFFQKGGFALFERKTSPKLSFAGGMGYTMADLSDINPALSWTNAKCNRSWIVAAVKLQLASWLHLQFRPQWNFSSGNMSENIYFAGILGVKLL